MQVFVGSTASAQAAKINTRNIFYSMLQYPLESVDSKSCVVCSYNITVYHYVSHQVGRVVPHLSVSSA